MGVEYFLRMLFRFFIVSFFVTILASCGGGGGTDTSSKPSPPSDSPGDGFGDCQSQLMSNEECFYPLPALENGESLPYRYKYDLEIDTKGVTVGWGVWLCREGRWYEIHSPICLTCRSGLSLEYCQSELERLIENKTRKQEEQK